MTNQHVVKRFFTCSDNGCTFSVVATDLAHAKAILGTSGVELVGDIAISHGSRPATWSELSVEEAANKRVYDDAAEPPDDQRYKPLTTFQPGDWFTTEY